MKKILLLFVLFFSFAANAQLINSTYYVIDNLGYDTCIVACNADSIKEITVSVNNQLFLSSDKCSTCFYIWNSGNDFTGMTMGYGFYQYLIIYNKPGNYILELTKYPSISEMKVLHDKINIIVTSP